MNTQTAVTHESVQKNFASNEFKDYEKFYEMCELLYNNVKDNEYYNTIKDIFNALEDKHIDVSGIISKDKYDMFKEQIIKHNPICPSIGKAPKPKYDFTTSEVKNWTF